MAGMNARHAANTRKTTCLVRTSQMTRPPNATISSRKKSVPCGSSTHTPRRGTRTPRTRAIAREPLARVPCGSKARAVEVGFEPTEGLPPHTLSRRAPSATRRLHHYAAYWVSRQGGARLVLRGGSAPESRFKVPQRRAFAKPVTGLQGDGLVEPAQQPQDQHEVAQRR